MVSRYIKNERIVFKEEGEGAFLFDSVNGNLKYLNRSAKEIYLMIDGTSEFPHLLGRVVGTYPDSDPDEIEKDLKAYLGDLTENRFIFAIDSGTDGLNRQT